MTYSECEKSKEIRKNAPGRFARRRKPQSFKGKIETNLQESSELPEASGFLLEWIVKA